MSIKVKVKKLTARTDDLPDQIKVEKLNEVAEDFAAEVARALGNLKCKKHPAQMSQITIIAERTHTMIIKKKCCCAEFEKLVSPKIDR